MATPRGWRSSYPGPVPIAIGTALKIASHEKWSVVQARKRFPNQADYEALSQFRCPIRFSNGSRRERIALCPRWVKKPTGMTAAQT